MSSISSFLTFKRPGGKTTNQQLETQSLSKVCQTCTVHGFPIQTGQALSFLILPPVLSLFAGGLVNILLGRTAGLALTGYAAQVCQKRLWGTGRKGQGCIMFLVLMNMAGTTKSKVQSEKHTSGLKAAPPLARHSTVAPVSPCHDSKEQHFEAFSSCYHLHVPSALFHQERWKR